MTWKEGHRIVDLCEMAQQMYCKDCSSLLDLNRTARETRFGLASVLHVVCQCGVTNPVHTSKREAGPGMTSVYIVNVKATISVHQNNRLEIEQLCKFLVGIDIPMTTEVFNSLVQKSVILNTVTPTAVGTERPLQMSTPQELGDPNKYDSHGCASLIEQSSTGWNVQDEKTTEMNKMEHGESPSSVMLAVVVDTETDGNQVDSSSNCQSSALDIQHPATFSTTGRTRKPGVKTFIVDDLCAPFKCGDCGARFALLRALNRHKKVHCNRPSTFFTYQGQECFPKHAQSKETETGDQNPDLKEAKTQDHHTNFREDSAISENSTDHFVDQEDSCQEEECDPKSDSCETKEIQRDESLDMQNVCTDVQHEKVGAAKEQICKGSDEGENHFKCQKCPAAFDTHSALENHLGVHAGQRLFSCQECSARFSKNRNLLSHVSRIHRKKRTFVCPDCGATLSTATGLKHHVRIHTGEMPYKCEVCEKFFRESSTLRTHMRLHTGNLPHVCQDCGKGFAFASALNKHKAIHSGQRPFTCPECKASFCYIAGLNLHMRIHTGERNFSCGICQKSFGQSGSLHRHLRTHCGDKSVLCQDCGKTFPSKDSLELHGRIHIREKPYEGSSCTATFRQSKGINSCAKIRTNEKLLCDMCPKLFTTLQSLRLHKEVHSEEEFVCQECGKAIVGKMRLRVHQKSHAKVINQKLDC